MCRAFLLTLMSLLLKQTLCCNLHASPPHFPVCPQPAQSRKIVRRQHKTCTMVPKSYVLYTSDQAQLLDFLWQYVTLLLLLASESGQAYLQDFSRSLVRKMSTQVILVFAQTTDAAIFLTRTASFVKGLRWHTSAHMKSKKGLW